MMMNSYTIWNFYLRSLKNAVLPIRGRALSSVSSTKLTNECPDKQPQKKLLKIAIIGAPNSGKSTLINQVVRRRVFPVSKKVHTTRCRARAVYVEGDTQLVFLDTPGLVTSSESQKYGLETEFMTGGEDAIDEADVIGVVHDLSNGFTKAHLDPKVLRLLYVHPLKESFLIMNKVDTVKSKRYLLDLSDLLTGGHLNKNKAASSLSQVSEKLVAEVIKRKSYWEHFRDVFMVSGLLGQGTDDIRSYFLRSAKPEEWLFPEGTFTDQKPVRLIEDTVRAALLDHLPQEIPYNLNIQLEFLDENADHITAVVLVGCKSLRIERLVVGSGGERIKAISSDAETILSDTFQKKMMLRIIVSTTTKSSEFRDDYFPIRKMCD